MATSGLDVGSLTGSTGSGFRLAGTGSGLDTAKLLEAMVAARRSVATRLETRIEKNDARIAGLEELRGHLGTLHAAVAGLRNPPGFLGAADNSFERKDVYFSADTTTSPASLLGVQAANSAASGRFEVIVEQLATARKFSGDPASSGSARLADSLNGGNHFSGTFTIGLAGSGRTAEIAVDGEMSLNDLRAAINAVTQDAGVSAHTLAVDATDHRLVLTAGEMGTEVSLAAGSGDDVLGILGLSADGGASFKNSLATAQQARFSVDGVTLERTTNTVTDAVPGLTFSLFRAEPGTKVSVEVAPALGSIKEKILGVVDAYNALKDFAATHMTLDAGGKVAADAVLYGDSNLRNVMQAAAQLVGEEVAGLDTGLARSLAGIGIRLNGANRLEVDNAKLDQTLLTRLDEVRGVFEFRFNASSAELTLFSRSSSFTAGSFSLDIVDADADGTPESASADGVAFDIVGKRLVGREGTAYEGLSMMWSGSGSTTIDVATSRGVGEKLFDLLDSTIAAGSGRLSQAIDSIAGQNERHVSEITRIDERVADYRENLIQRFAAMEQAMSLAESMIQQIRAQMAGMGSEP
ncbi:flagellar filament capping protein FliD [Geminicoccaceae bacterium 1502E]|nr:flagellar filament capping protein FliD [Geminicoccaceae bacterium 1502E]